MIALQWNGLNYDEVLDFVGKNCRHDVVASRVVITSMRGDERIVNLDDFIIQGVDDDFYPVKREVH